MSSSSALRLYRYLPFSPSSTHHASTHRGGGDPFLGSVCSWGWCEDPKIGSVELLGCDAKLAFEQREDGLHIHLPIFPSHLPQRNPGKYAYSSPIVPNRGRSRFGPCASLSRRPQELRPEVFPAIERHDCKSCPSRFTSRSAGHFRPRRHAADLTLPAPFPLQAGPVFLKMAHDPS